jgi:hypothetical protein
MAGRKPPKKKIDVATLRTKYVKYRRTQLTKGKEYVSFKAWQAGKR